uniref:G_PROTEIN_RECEP_F1_2 domain-containing protein n=1 Tax=Caenorhabditis tropicalis TaxID=1561998 RepID=A0A1I7T8B2_9PELO
MGAYSADYVCVPTPNNALWIPVVVLQFIIVIFGCLSHSIFFHFIVFSKRFGSYSRSTFALISIQMIIILLTSAAAFLITLFNGKYIEDCVISDIYIRKWMLYIHSFAEFFFVVSECMGTHERVISVFYPEVRRKSWFKWVFTICMLTGVGLSILYIYFVRIAFKKLLFALGFGGLTALEIYNGALVFWLLGVAMTKYQTNKEATLNYKYEFSQSYTYSRCAAASVTVRIFIIIYIYLQVFGLLEASSAFYYVMNLLINMYSLVYPWSIMLSHRKTRKEVRIAAMRFFCIRASSVHYESEVKKLYTIDGRQMNAMTGVDHFKQLDSFWGATPSTRTL